ncbi:MAG: deoxyribose-phosphate aldolase [Bacteroidetes bacterium]|nr:MAG: deoxyribose-phosphate aldolase [Bacteroidota bacterium]
MDLARTIDHTILKPGITSEDVKEKCQEAKDNSFAAVCIPPYFVNEAATLLENSGVKVATVIGFPMGYSAVSAKVEEIKKAVNDGADELDAVINICAVKSGNWNYLKNEIESLTTACHMKGKILKLIIETGMLTEEEIRQVCEISVVADVDYIKTSTGMNGPGASLETVKLLREILPKKVKIKASGGIRDRAFAEQLIQAGADRIGTSSGVQIISG